MSFRQAQGDIPKTFNHVFPTTNNRNHPVTLSLSKSMVISTNNQQQESQGDSYSSNFQHPSSNRNHPVTLSLSKSMVISTNNQQPTTNNQEFLISIFAFFLL
jgi:hypothetical protein